MQRLCVGQAVICEVARCGDLGVQEGGVPFAGGQHTRRGERTASKFVSTANDAGKLEEWHSACEHNSWIARIQLEHVTRRQIESFDAAAQTHANDVELVVTGLPQCALR